MKYSILQTALIFVICVSILSYGCGRPRDGATGSPGMQGERGAAGSQGVPGQVGATGAQGIPGPTGANGQDADPIVTQAFCPNLFGGIGFQESYIVIEGWPYAVYYDSVHTFLTKLKPGSYVTTDGRNCHFTVDVNGVVHD